MTSEIQKCSQKQDFHIFETPEAYETKQTERSHKSRVSWIQNQRERELDKTNVAMRSWQVLAKLKRQKY